MMKMWRFIALAVLLLGTAGITRLYCVGFVWKNGLSVETTVVLFAGLLAFLAVMIQVEAEWNARADEREGQKRAVAAAILFEIDHFYFYHVGEAWRYVEEALRGRELPEVARIPCPLFSVYQGNAGRLGDLPNEVVRAVVDFYSKAAQFLAIREDYRGEHERHLDLPFEHPDNRKAIILCGNARDFLLGLARAAYSACEKLCGVAELDFKPPGIAVAGADIAALNRETERIEQGQIHRI